MTNVTTLKPNKALLETVNKLIQNMAVVTTPATAIVNICQTVINTLREDEQAPLVKSSFMALASSSKFCNHIISNRLDLISEDVSYEVLEMGEHYCKAIIKVITQNQASPAVSIVVSSTARQVSGKPNTQEVEVLDSLPAMAAMDFSRNSSMAVTLIHDLYDNHRRTPSLVARPLVRQAGKLGDNMCGIRTTNNSLPSRYLVNVDAVTAIDENAPYDINTLD